MASHFYTAITPSRVDESLSSKSLVADAWKSRQLHGSARDGKPYQRPASAMLNGMDRLRIAQATVAEVEDECGSPKSPTGQKSDTLSQISEASSQTSEDSSELGPLPTPKPNFRSLSMNRDQRPQNLIVPSKERGRQTSLAESLTESLNAAREASNTRRASNVTARLLQSPLIEETGTLTPSTARYASEQSPCFYHERFDDAINIKRVLEEVEAEDDINGCPTSRLLKTATSVREVSKQLQRHPIRRAVRSVMIVTKARDNDLVYLTRELALWLLSTPRYGSDVGVNVYVDAKLRRSKRFDAAGIIEQNPRFRDMLRFWDPDLCWSSPERFDLALTLGGDGTVLYTSFSLFQRVVPPVLAFSLGSLGFLTNYEFSSYQKSLDKVMGDSGMRVNLRMRFTCTVFRADLQRQRPKGSKISPVDTSEMVEAERFEVLNELVIDRGPSPYVSNLELYGDDELLTVVQADGCIFSTPTGSTAYSLSAGGPLTHPSIPGIMLTPICPHTLSFRPMVLSDGLQLKVCIPRGSRSTAYASFDGKHRVELRRGDCVQIEAGRFPFPTVVGEHGTGGEWFDSVRRALRWNTRGAMQKSFKSSNKPGSAAQATRWEPEDELFMAAQKDEDSFDLGGDSEEEQWDIDPDDSTDAYDPVDSGLGASEISSASTGSPRRCDSMASLS